MRRVAGKFGKSDGIVGLAFPSLAAPGTINFFDNLMKQVVYPCIHTRASQHAAPPLTPFNICIDICIDTGTDISMNTYIGMCIDMCTDMFMNSSASSCGLWCFWAEYA